MAQTSNDGGFLMSVETFRALVVDQPEGVYQATLRNLTLDQLPAGDVLIDVSYSSLNYKDGLAITGQGKIIRSFPFVPGIDLAGTVHESRDARYQPGDAVILTGWGVGERYWGGYSQLARVKGDWLVRLPDGLSLADSMAIGTAGFTAMLAVMALEEHNVLRSGREVLVTGAAGGVGSVALALLSKLGYRVVASTGRQATHDYLQRLGASEVIDRSVLVGSAKPLEAERWGGVVDAVGGETLAKALAMTATGGSVAACGLAGGSNLPTTVFPFILRGVNLLGIDSVMCPLNRRMVAWQRLASDLPMALLTEMTDTISLDQLPTMANQILQGQVRGRIVVDLNR